MQRLRYWAGQLFFYGFCAYMGVGVSLIVAGLVYGTIVGGPKVIYMMGSMAAAILAIEGLIYVFFRYWFVTIPLLLVLGFGMMAGFNGLFAVFLGIAIVNLCRGSSVR